jgi:probable rRNA maturation factor
VSEARGGGPEIEIAWDWPGERPLDDAAVRRAAAAALRHGERAGIGLGIVFVDDAHLAAMHAEYLDDPTETDVITFDLGADGGGPAGELYVSVDRARARAAQRGVSAARELALYVVHGALHLCGFDDREPDERLRMRAAERAVMDGLGYEPDDAPHED